MAMNMIERVDLKLWAVIKLYGLIRNISLHNPACVVMINVEIKALCNDKIPSNNDMISEKNK